MLYREYVVSIYRYININDQAPSSGVTRRLEVSLLTTANDINGMLITLQ